MNPAIVLHIAGRELRSQLRNRSFLVQTFLLPILLTTIIGFALGGNAGQPAPSPVGLVGPSGLILDGLEKVLQTGGLAQVRRVSHQEAENGVLSGRLIAAIEVPDQARRLTRSAATPATPAVVSLLADPASQVRTVALEQVTRSYLAQLESGRAAVLAVVQTLRPPDASTLGKIATKAQQEASAAFAKPQITSRVLLTGGGSHGYFAHYAVAFGVMFTLLTATYGAGGLLEEAERGSLARVLAAPITAGTLLGGKFTALFLSAVLQLGVFVLASSLLFAVSWGAPLPAALGVLVVSLGAAGVGGVVIGLSHSVEQLNVFGLLISLLMSLLGGSMYPLEGVAGVIQVLSYFTFNRWAIEVFEAVSITNMSLIDAAPQFGVLAALGLLGLAFGSWQLSRRFRLS